MPENYGTPEELTMKTCPFKAASNFPACHGSSCAVWVWLDGEWWECECGYRGENNKFWQTVGDKYLCPKCGELMRQIVVGGCGLRMVP